MSYISYIARVKSVTGEHPCENVSDRERNPLRKHLRHIFLWKRITARGLWDKYLFKNDDFSIDKRGPLSKRLPNICIQVAPILGSCVLPTYSHLDGVWPGDSNVNIRLLKKTSASIRNSYWTMSHTCCWLFCRCDVAPYCVRYLPAGCLGKDVDESSPINFVSSLALNVHAGWT